jgi:hypothetical protein
MAVLWLLGISNLVKLLADAALLSLDARNEQAYDRKKTARDRNGPQSSS